ncbi:hypothetical protein [Virgibacillus halodenitrificans]|uniref:DUF1795 domain-containing protein n=1 Tax=Virgibacillus halodenitrificans TaxID=1482 RepID=A0ABR7VIU5_VIRHA|nr:hypothetical protein [Virgibacillus halodenitrificans]MBD1221847.1 hypothetical protein [Virgibacillus halodenitrificans]
MDQEKSTKPAEMSVEDLPDVRAFQDEFTREFLQSTEETREGYYPFLSGTEAYKMDFPANGEISEKSYSIKEKGFESFFIGINQSKNEALINVNYNSIHKGIDSMKDLLEKQLDENLNFNKYESNHAELQVATYTELDTGFGMAGVIFDKNSKGGIIVSYETSSLNKDEQKKLKKVIVEWMKSFEFTSSDKEKANDNK